jgi:hypothetical protein
MCLTSTSAAAIGPAAAVRIEALADTAFRYC